MHKQVTTCSHSIPSIYKLALCSISIAPLDSDLVLAAQCITRDGCHLFSVQRTIHSHRTRMFSTANSLTQTFSQFPTLSIHNTTSLVLVQCVCSTVMCYAWLMDTQGQITRPFLFVFISTLQYMSIPPLNLLFRM